MESNLLSLSKIFAHKIFRIPDYQRGYAWSKKQVQDFFEDLIKLEKEKNHYVGVLTIEKVSSERYSTWEDDNWIITGKSFEAFYIVDGQQRLTTSIIFLKCIINEMQNRQMEKLNYSSADEIIKQFIYESKDNGISKSFLFGYEKDNPSYEFLKQKILNTHSDQSFQLQETIYTNNLEDAFSYFTNELKKRNQEELEDIYFKLTQRFLFNIYLMSSDIDVYVAFETMNNRGKPLSHLELLKNRLIYLSTRIDGDDSDKIKLRTAVNECWKTIYHQLGRNKLNPLDDDVFLSSHFIVYFGKLIFESESNNYRKIIHRYRNTYQSDLLDDIFTIKSLAENKLTLNELYEYVKSLKNCVKTWYFINNPLDSNSPFGDITLWLERINRISREHQATLTIVMTFLDKCIEVQDRTIFLKELEKYLFIRQITNKNDLDFNQLSYKLYAAKMKPKLVISEIMNNNKTSVSYIALNKTEVLKRLREYGFYNWELISYFLYEYEQSLIFRSKTAKVKLDWEQLYKYGSQGRRYIYFDDDRDSTLSEHVSMYDYSSIEHIYPITTKKAYWTEIFRVYTQKERGILKNLIGNLLPLSKPKNSSLKNISFEEKKNGRNSDSLIGYKYGSLSEIEVSENQQWTAIEIYHRTIKLVKFMFERWELGSITDKEITDSLGLQFIKNKEGIK